MSSASQESGLKESSIKKEFMSEVQQLKALMLENDKKSDKVEKQLTEA